jgi:hypothetical protein
MTTSFPIPASAQTTTGTTSESTGDKPEKSDYSIEDFLIDQHLLPKRKNDKRHKAMRLLTSGRLRVLRVEGELIVAECKGDSGEVYKLGPDRLLAPERSVGSGELGAAMSRSSLAIGFGWFCGAMTQQITDSLVWSVLLALITGLSFGVAEVVWDRDTSEQR